MKLLIIEDEASLSQMMQRALQEAGFVATGSRCSAASPNWDGRNVLSSHRLKGRSKTR